MNISSIFLLALVVLIIKNAKAGNFYTSANNKLYYVEANYSYKWFEAHIECHNRNMTLYTIDNEESFYDLYNILISGKLEKKPPHLWLGAIGAHRKLTWIVNGQPVVWKYGSFDNSGDAENCLQLYENTKNLNDRNCLNLLGFVCEENRYIKSGGKCDQNRSSDKHIVFNFQQHCNN